MKSCVLLKIYVSDSDQLRLSVIMNAGKIHNITPVKIRNGLWS